MPSRFYRLLPDRLFHDRLFHDRLFHDRLFHDRLFQRRFYQRFYRMALLLVVLPCQTRSSQASSTRPLVPLPAGSHVVAPPTDPDRFTFLLAGDNRSAGRGVPAPPTAGQIFAEVRLLQPALVLWSGDTIYGSDDTPGEAEAEYDHFLAQAARAATPIYNAPGNHEIYDRPELAALYEAKMGRLYGSFDYGHSHFIALNTEEIGLPGGIGQAQRAWLKADLEANRQAAHIFVFMHHPLFPKEEPDGFADRANRDEIHRLFVQYGVKHVFAGHEHLFYHSEHDGVTYWVSGGAGAPTDAAPEDGGFHHFVRFAVDGEKVTATVLQPWRLFVSVGPEMPDGSRAALASNYNNADLPLCIEFPAGVLAADALPAATWTYKGKTHPLEAAVVPSRAPGALTVRVVVPKHRSALVTIRPHKQP